MSGPSVFTVAREALLPALQAARAAVERRTTIPVLANLLVEARDGRLSLTGTNLDLEVTASCPAEGRLPAMTVPAGLFVDAVRKLPEGVSVRVEADAHFATISAARSKFRLPILPAVDFHRMATGDLPHQFEMDGADLDRILGAVTFAISSEETRYYLNGIHFHQSERDGEKKLVAVATDGHRLSVIDLPLPEGADGMSGIILPRATCALLKGFGGKGKVSIGLSASKVRFAVDGTDGFGTTIVSKLIDGTFPDYSRVVPPRYPNTFGLDCEQFSTAVDRVVTISAGAKSSAVKFTFDTDTLVLLANNPDVGTAEDAVAVSDATGDKVEIGFNGRYCLDMLQACPSERVKVYLGDPGSPARIEPEGQDDQVFVIMPMRV
ncbi:DNA polymerase III subunit beta [Mycolicibacterium aubagnense]